MTVNVEALIRSLGKSYHEIMEARLIPYQTEPKGFSGSPNLSIDMKKEGVFLSFKREGRVLQGIELIIIYEKVKNWVFPNELPSPLKTNMSRSWVHDTFGPPDGNVPPKTILKKQYGWTDKFTVEGFHIPITMQMHYDLNDQVERIYFLPTSELRW
ncbi:Uncharacterised protein [Leminorella richardii]|uniref:Pyocin immunity protein n=1 Tax=Leminorella richardii TaxID=158841 RepID=A0A2X4V0B3_9GAMM|nr:DUF6392 family protein [Leminorella richardii]SQI44069.1 Uncharacterised protein [Leminorella richardii]